MGLLSNLFGSLRSPSQYMYRLFGNWSTASKKSVTPNTSLEVSAVYACVDLISATIASLPFEIYKKTNTGREKIDTTRLAYLLSKRPNNVNTSYQFRYTVVANMLLTGNAYIEIIRDKNGIESFRLLPPGTVEVFTDQTLTVVKYMVTNYDSRNTVKELLPDRVIHIKCFTLDGIVGVSPITYARETIGNALSAKENQGLFYANGAMPKGILSIEGTIKDPAKIKALSDQWTAGISGDNQGKTPVLSKGAEFKPVSLSQKDAQYIEDMQFTVEEIARFFRLSPQKIGYQQSGSYSGSLEQLNIAFATDCITPIVTAMEQEFDSKIFSVYTTFTELDIKGLIRGDIQSRTMYYNTMRNIGVMNANEIRYSEGLPPREDGKGDEYFEPANMVPDKDVENGKINKN